MQFSDIPSAAGYYASRYAEYAAGRLAPEALQAEREALTVVEPSGARWVMDPWGRWVSAPPAGTATPRTALIVGAAVVVMLLAAGALFFPGREATMAPQATGLVGALQDGGHVLYLRHAERDEIPEEVTDPEDCSQQANLTAGGQEQARAIGEAFRELGIPVGAVYASPYCRTRDTATLAFGTVTPVPQLAGASQLPPVDPAVQAATLNQLLTDPTPAGANVVIVGHSEVVESVTGEAVSDFAETVVFRPTGDGQYQVVGHVPYARLQQWRTSCPPDCS
jgi:phosphohistidine phosphatase SixA